MVTLHGFVVPVQPLLHPVNVEPAVAAAVSVTGVRAGKDSLQSVGQLIPAGLLVTVPLPPPASCTVTVWDSTRVKVAVTLFAASIVTLQPTVPVHTPLQLVKAKPALGAAVRVMTLPVAKDWAQSVGQSIPTGLLVTRPPSAGSTCTAKVWVVGWKVAVTVLAASIGTWQEPVPAHA